jgi:signal transduction histidine kinase/ligand-binding sensor domain-containing protein/DNA-binding NarL/FixJ family response regulator
VQQAFQDSDGYFWFATRNGLARYNGYDMEVFKSNIYSVDLLSNNNINSIAEDNERRIWIGTADGLNVYDRRTAAMTKINRPEFRSNIISQVLVTSKGKLLVGTDNGLYEYHTDTDSCTLYSRAYSGDVMPQTSVKSLCEDTNGSIWIGTWNEGIYRIDSHGKFYAYPRINEHNSAHVIFQDSHGGIWVGSWGYGLFKLNNPYTPRTASWTNFRHSNSDPTSLGDDIIYSIAENRATGSVWVGTRSGISVYNSATGNFIDLSTKLSDYLIQSVTSIICDRQGLMWFSMVGAGVVALDTNATLLGYNRLPEISAIFKTNLVRSVLPDNDGTLWLSIGSAGLIKYDPATGAVKTMKQMGFPVSDEGSYTVQTIVRSHDGTIYIGSYDGGIFVYNTTEAAANRIKQYTTHNSKWVPGDRVFAIYEDSHHRMWFGGIDGLSYRDADGTYHKFDINPQGNSELSNVKILDINEDSAHNLWIATEADGILRLSSTGNSKTYNAIHRYWNGNGKMPSGKLNCIYSDAKGRVWVGAEGYGLYLYNADKDTFESVHLRWNLPGDNILSIISDDNGAIWMGSNVGLIRLTVDNDAAHAHYRLFTSYENAQDNYSRNAVVRDNTGQLFFAGKEGINYFYPDNINDNFQELPITITDIKIFGTSWAKLDPDIRYAISPVGPEFADKITLKHNQNSIYLTFAVLDYSNNPLHYTFSYRLDGVDKDWQYADNGHRFAIYNHLDPGKYTFHLRVTAPDGTWRDTERVLTITVEPPFWLSWWAKLIYLMIIIGLLVVAYKVITLRTTFRNALYRRELEREQADQLNHTKLQFFTNITHEFLTPLSIISASIDEMKAKSHDNNEYYEIMTSNINRLIRLVQQILEFRKAETGNLHLKVSRGDISEFVTNTLENFGPIMRRKHIFYSVLVEPEHLTGYFDRDKLDKILYNLVSNASKYIPDESTVWVDLRHDSERNMVVLRVRDNGPGISREGMRNLFKRFYEGEYRKFKTTGTGIGLSLTKDLVDLHHGTITATSEEGKGTEFTVELPIGRDAYLSTEIDDESAAKAPKAGSETPEATTPEAREKEYSLLVTEDNQELLTLITRLLSREYNVFAAHNGVEGCKILEKEEVDLIITDVMMPEMDGMEFCHKIKEEIATSHIPVIILTARSLDEARVEAYNAGADAFISKPFSRDVLLARISNLLKTRKRANESFRKQFDVDVNKLEYTSIDEMFLKKTVDCITAHISDPDFSQTMFVEEMGISKSTLFRKLKSMTGMSYSSFVRNIRLKVSCQIMREKRNIRVSELAFAVGFNDPKYFSICFKKEFGMQPSEYLEQITDEESPTEPTTPQQ